MIEVFKEILNALNDIKETLGMDANYFYPALVTIAIALLTFLKGTVVSINNKKKDSLLQLYRNEESDYFYFKVMMIEFILFFISLLISILMCSLIFVVMFYNKINMEKMFWVMVIIFSAFISWILMKTVFARNLFIRKRVVGERKSKWLIYIPIILYNLWMFYSAVFPQSTLCLTFVNILICIFEIYGLFIFRGRYVKYKYSHLTIYTSNGDVIICKDVSKIKRMRSIVIIENEDEEIRIRYDNILRISYSGQELTQLKRWI